MLKDDQRFLPDENRHLAAMREADRIRALLAQNPEIGILGHGTNRRYYVTINGNIIENPVIENIINIIKKG